MDAVVVGEQDAHGLGQDRVLGVSARASEAPRFSRADLISFGVAAAASVLALVLEEAGASGAVVFVAAAVSVMALAYVLGEATEQAGTASGPRLAALLNATFGNLPELIIVVLTVREGLIDVARASIIGSVVGNILLVLGASILLGGLRNGPMKFDQASAGMNASMLTLAAVALGIPSLFDALHDTTRHEQVALSYGTAVIMVIVYAAYLVYSLTQPGEQSHHGEGRWSARTAMLTLAVTALVTGAMSELLVSAIEPTIKEIGIGTVFIGMVVVPLVGNVPEHWAAVRIARARQPRLLDGHRLQLGPAGRPGRHRHRRRRGRAAGQRGADRVPADRARAAGGGHDHDGHPHQPPARPTGSRGCSSWRSTWSPRSPSGTSRRASSRRERRAGGGCAHPSAGASGRGPRRRRRAAGSRCTWSPSPA